MIQIQTESRPYTANGASPNGNGHAGGNGKTARVPPHNLQAEESLLGAMLLSRDAIDAGTEIISANDFYKPAHANIFAAIESLAARGEPADPVTVHDELTRQGLGDQSGGLGVLINLQAETPATTNAPRYARIVADHSTLRRLIGVAGEISEIGYSTPEDVTLAVDHAEQLLYVLGDQRQVIRAVSFRDAIEPWLTELERRYREGTTMTGVPSGLIELDEMLTGFHPGELITIAGRPGMGKSLLGQQFATHISLEHNLPSIVVSIEMSKEEMLDRLMAAEARIDHHRVRTGQLNEGDWQRLSTATSRMADMPLYIHDLPTATLTTIRAEIRRVKNLTGSVGLVVVDYLQLLSSTQKAENRQVEVAELTKGLKHLAREMDVPVIALAQLNRNLEARSDKRPTLADLRESGAVEQDSSVVIFIYRDEYYKPDSPDRGTAELIVAKHRNGRTGTVNVAFLAHYGIFANMARV